MKYVCLMYQDEALMQKLSKEDAAKLNADYQAWAPAAYESGRLVASYGLQPTPTATTVRLRDRTRATTRGPVTASSEPLGGIYIVDAPDLDTAIEFAATIPSARYGSIEVRPVWG